MSNKMVAVTIGTRVSFAWETVSGQRPTTGYKVWCDCTSHPDLNPARDQIETTTLCQQYNHTYVSGLRDFGELEFGSNLTQDTLDLFIGDNGYHTLYEQKQEQGLGLWACIDIKHINKSYYIPVAPQDFGMPDGEAGSNKYDLSVYFSVVGDAVWASDPIYDNQTTYKVTFDGYEVSGVELDVLKGDKIVYSITTSDTTTVVNLEDGKYIAIARMSDKDTQIKDVNVSGSNTTITFNTFA